MFFIKVVIYSKHFFLSAHLKEPALKRLWASVLCSESHAHLLLQYWSENDFQTNSCSTPVWNNIALILKESQSDGFLWLWHFHTFTRHCFHYSWVCSLNSIIFFDIFPVLNPWNIPIEAFPKMSLRANNIIQAHFKRLGLLYRLTPRSCTLDIITLH